MAQTKELFTRIQHKHDIETNWIKAVNFIPLAGEIIIYDKDEGHDYTRIKIGDGSTKINELPYHSIGDVTGLQTVLDGKVPISRTINGKALSSNITLSASDVGAYSKAEIDGYMEYFTNNMPEEIMYVIGAVQDDGSVTIDKILADITQAAVIDMKAVYTLLVINNTEIFILPLTVFEPNQLAIFARTVDGDTIALVVDESGAAFVQMEGVTKEDLDIHIDNKNNPHNVTASQIGLSNVENKSSATIRGELTKENITTALGYTPLESSIGKAGTGINSEVFNTTTTNKAEGSHSHAEGYNSGATGDFSHAEGRGTTASGYNSHAEGYGTTASGNTSHAEGGLTTALGAYSHAEGYSLNKLPDTITSTTNIDTIISTWNTTKFTLAGGNSSHAEGNNTLALGDKSHAEGTETIASGRYSHAEGSLTTASGIYSHAEGSRTTASNNNSHAEGGYTTASGIYSHAEGFYTTASGEGSHAEGYYTVAASQYQHVQGKYNIEDTFNTYAHIVGNGNVSVPSNAHTLDWNGNAWFKGDIYLGGTGQNDSNVTKLIKSKLVATETTPTVNDTITWMYE